MKKNILIGIIAAAVIIIGIIFYFVKTADGAPFDWKTYQNTTYNYSLRYPKDWHVFTPSSDLPIQQRGSPEAPVYMGGDTQITSHSLEEIYKENEGKRTYQYPDDFFSISLTFIKDDAADTIDKYLEKQQYRPFDKKENLKIDGKDAVKITFPAIEDKGATKPAVLILIKVGDKFANLFYNISDTDSDKTAETIIKSLNFR